MAVDIDAARRVQGEQQLIERCFFANARQHELDRTELQLPHLLRAFPRELCALASNATPITHPCIIGGSIPRGLRQHLGRFKVSRRSSALIDDAHYGLHDLTALLNAQIGERYATEGGGNDALWHRLDCRVEPLILKPDEGERLVFRGELWEKISVTSGKSGV